MAAGNCLPANKTNLIAGPGSTRLGPSERPAVQHRPGVWGFGIRPGDEGMSPLKQRRKKPDTIAPPASYRRIVCMYRPTGGRGPQRRVLCAGTRARLARVVVDDAPYRWPHPEMRKGEDQRKQWVRWTFRLHGPPFSFALTLVCLTSPHHPSGAERAEVQIPWDEWARGWLVGLVGYTEYGVRFDNINQAGGSTMYVAVIQRPQPVPVQFKNS